MGEWPEDIPIKLTLAVGCVCPKDVILPWRTLAVGGVCGSRRPVVRLSNVSGDRWQCDIVGRWLLVHSAGGPSYQWWQGILWIIKTVDIEILSLNNICFFPLHNQHHQWVGRWEWSLPSQFDRFVLGFFLGNNMLFSSAITLQTGEIFNFLVTHGLIYKIKNKFYDSESSLEIVIYQ